MVNNLLVENTSKLVRVELDFHLNTVYITRNVFNVSF
jgi:hypothetical protein